MSKQKTDAATILDSSACNARCKLSKILLWYTAFVNFDKNAHFAQAKVFKIVTMRPFIYYVSKRQGGSSFADIQYCIFADIAGLLQTGSRGVGGGGWGAMPSFWPNS